MNDEFKMEYLYSNLLTYVHALLKDYSCRNIKRPSILVELSKEMNGLSALLSSSKLSSTDYELKSNLDNILKLLKTSNVDEKELSSLINSVNNDWEKHKNKKIERFEEKVKYVTKLNEKAIKKISFLRRDGFVLHEDNYDGLIEMEKQDISHSNSGHLYGIKSNFCHIYKEPHSKETISFEKGMEIYLTFIQRDVNKVEVSSNNKEIEFIDSMQQEKKILDEYDKMVSQGKIKVENNKPLTFFGKMGFQPLKKRISEREIIEKISQTGYIIDLLDYAISTIKENKGSIDFSKTLEELHSLSQKYSIVSKKLRDDLKNSNYEEMKKAVENRQEIERQERIEELNKQKVKLLYKKVLKSDNDEEIKQLLEEIRFVELSDSDKEIEKNNAAVEYETEIENKQIEKQIIREEYEKEQEYKKEVANGLRQRAIEELEMQNAFAPDYYESGLDVKNSMTSDRKEELIQRKMNELKNKDKITKQEQALRDLKEQGFLKRDDATLSNLKPFEHDALLAQMRINARAEQEQSTGYSR